MQFKIRVHAALAGLLDQLLQWKVSISLKLVNFSNYLNNNLWIAIPRVMVAMVVWNIGHSNMLTQTQFNLKKITHTLPMGINNAKTHSIQEK